MKTLDFEPNLQCKECGGRCCKQMSGPYLPEDILRIFGSVKTAINSGKVAIDWLEGRYTQYFMRPKLKNAIYALYDPSWGGECIHLEKNGCSLPRDQRPYFCKSLEPRSTKDGACNQHVEPHCNSKYAAAAAWKKSKINLKGLNG